MNLFTVWPSWRVKDTLHALHLSCSHNFIDQKCSRFQKPSAVIPLQLCHLQYTQPILVGSKWLHSILASALTRHPRHPRILESLRPRGLHYNFTNGLSWPYTMTGFSSSLWPFQLYRFLATQSSATGATSTPYPVQLPAGDAVMASSEPRGTDAEKMFPGNFHLSDAGLFLIAADCSAPADQY